MTDNTARDRLAAQLWDLGNGTHVLTPFEHLNRHAQQIWRAKADRILAALPGLGYITTAQAEKDERIIAWDQIACHPALRECYNTEGTLIAAFLKRLTDMAAAEVEVSRPVGGDNTETITIPRPHVPFGPEGISADQADADYLRAAVSNMQFRRDRGEGSAGSNLTETVFKLLTDAADALAPKEQ